MNNNGILTDATKRLPAIDAASVLQHARRATATATESLSRAGAMRAGAEYCNRAMSRFILLCYERDETGFVNVDETGILEKFPAPWGKSYKRFELRSMDRDVLHLHVKRLQTLHRPIPLYNYDVDRRWAVNLDDYPTLAQAQAYWKLVELDAKTYKLLLRQVQDSRRGRAA